MRWIFMVLIGWVVVIISGLMLHELVHIAQFKFDYEQFCLVGYDRQQDMVGWVVHSGDDSDRYVSRTESMEMQANIIGFGMPLLAFVLWMRRL